MGAQLKNILPGVQVRSGKRGKTIRFSCMIRGQRFAEMCDEPVEMMIDPSSGRATRLLKQAYNRWVDQCQAKAGHSKKGKLREPTIAELLKTYEEIAWERNRDPNYNRPSAGRIESVGRYYGYCVDASGLSSSRPYSDLMDVDMVRKIFRHFCSSGVKGITAWTYLSALQSVTAKWTLALYRDRGFDVRAPLIPDVGKAKEAPSYQQLSTELSNRIDDWILTLDKNAGPDVVLYVTLINNLAIRPNDMGSLTAENFPLDRVSGHHRFCYVPQKTKESSNRRVDIEIPDALWEQIYSLCKNRYDAGERILPSWRYIGNVVNTSMRIACAMPKDKYTKAGYELRKRCLHREMISQGIDVAVQLSGDRRDTLEKYSVDPYRGQKPLQLYQPPSASPTTIER